MTWSKQQLEGWSDPNTKRLAQTFRARPGQLPARVWALSQLRSYSGPILSTYWNIWYKNSCFWIRMLKKQSEMLQQKTSKNRKVSDLNQHLFPNKSVAPQGADAPLHQQVLDAGAQGLAVLLQGQGQPALHRHIRHDEPRSLLAMWWLFLGKNGILYVIYHCKHYILYIHQLPHISEEFHWYQRVPVSSISLSSFWGSFGSCRLFHDKGQLPTTSASKKVSDGWVSSSIWRESQGGPRTRE